MKPKYRKMFAVVHEDCVGTADVVPLASTRQLAILLWEDRNRDTDSKFDNKAKRNGWKIRKYLLSTGEVKK